MQQKHDSNNVFAGCDRSIARAITAFRGACTPSYTTRSRKYSIWSLVALHIEPTLSAYLRDQRFVSLSRSFDGHGFASAMKQDAGKLEDLLRSYIRRCRPLRDAWTFRATIDSLIAVSHFCRSRVPNRVVGDYPKGQKHPPKKRMLPAPSSDVAADFPYCELCWQLCQHEDERIEKKDLRRSERFCTDHDPRNPGSRYRTDHSYRKKFQRKLTEIYKELPNNREKWIRLAGDIDAVSIRRYAYEFLHAHPIDDRLKAIHLSIAGHTNTEIAIALGKTRQMVHKFLNSPLKGEFGLLADGTVVRIANVSSERN